MRSLWARQIRPAIVVASFVIFFILVRPQGHSSGLINDRRHQFVRRSLLSKPYSGEHEGSAGLQDSDQFYRRTNFESLLTSLADEKEADRSSASSSPVPVILYEGLEEQVASHNRSQRPDKLVEDPPHVLCGNAREHVGYPDTCSYVKANPECRSEALINYIHFFFCTCESAPLVAYIALAIWLVILFYMMGNQAADFFCCSIQKLSTLLHLPPTVAGVTLLPFGNGAPDVFASIAAFMGAGQGQVGLNSVLGGATFVTSVVAGSASLVVAQSSVQGNLDRGAFLRDIAFFLFTLAALTIILFQGEIHFWAAIAYVSIYGAYGVTVAAVEFLKSHGHKLVQWHALQPLLQGQAYSPLSDDETGYGGPGGPYSELFDTRRGFSSAVETTLPQWRWAPHVAIYSQTSNLQAELERIDSGGERPLWGNHEQQAAEAVNSYSLQRMIAYVIEWPLTLPRRLTTPLAEDDRWSKFYAVSSATLAPLLLAFVWDGSDGEPMGSAWKEYIFAAVVGLVLGGVALFTTQKEHPPRRYLFPWALGGFVMSIVWFYIIANELVAALVALGVVMEIDPAILGLTVLAWGNSIGDLMSNLALVYHGGDGVQIAFSGCWAGPMFNTLMGIGLSLVLASWKTYPEKFQIPEDPSIFFTLAFLVAGLVWAVIVLPARQMQPTKGLGVGLLVLYATFLTVRVALTLGFTFLTSS